MREGMPVFSTFVLLLSVSVCWLLWTGEISHSLIHTSWCVWCQPLRHLRTAKEGKQPFKHSQRHRFFLPLLSPLGLSNCSPRLQLAFIQDCLSACDTHTTNKKTYTQMSIYILYRNAYTRNIPRNWNEESKWWWPLKNTHKQRTHQLTDRYLQIYLKIYTSLIITAIPSLHLTNGSRKLILLL